MGSLRRRAGRGKGWSEASDSPGGTRWPTPHTQVWNPSSACSVGWVVSARPQCLFLCGPWGTVQTCTCAAGSPAALGLPHPETQALEVLVL